MAARAARIAGFEFALPGPGWTLAQLALSALDWALAAAVFFVLLPPAPACRSRWCLGAYLLAQVVGLVRATCRAASASSNASPVLLLRRSPLG
jgi:uncharacterized membrane protein YbhN (UPF0104 family)